MLDLITKCSFSVGDRFAHQAKAQLKAFLMAKNEGCELTPVWNKSYREHSIIGSESETTRKQADWAVKELGWQGPYLLDADHINLSNVDFFMETCDFYTIDVAEYIGKKTENSLVDDFYKKHQQYIGSLDLPDLEKVEVTDNVIRQVGHKYLFATIEAGKIYRYIRQKRGDQPFVVEISMDETNEPQTPVELFFILAALAYQKVPVQTIAPKFSGRFNKGVDYVGDLNLFKKEFEQDVSVLKLAVKEFGFHKNLKLSVHSGSDKLEELIGLAESEGKGVEIAKNIYKISLDRFDELCAPYAAVIDIDKSKLPSVETVKNWDGKKFAQTLRHDQANSKYNPDFRQLLHVGYKIAAKLGTEYLKTLEDNKEIVGRNVTENIFERHIKPLFLD